MLETTDSECSRLGWWDDLKNYITYELDQIIFWSKKITEIMKKLVEWKSSEKLDPLYVLCLKYSTVIELCVWQGPVKHNVLKLTSCMTAAQAAVSGTVSSSSSVL